MVVEIRSKSEREAFANAAAIVRELVTNMKDNELQRDFFSVFQVKQLLEVSEMF